MKKTLATILALCFGGLTITSNSLADTKDAALRQLFEQKLKLKIESITPAPIKDLYEVVASGSIYYADAAGGFYFDGNLMQANTGKNLTAIRRFSRLPLELAAKQVKGNGKHVFVSFEDPHCGYCKKLAQEVLKMKNVTLYTFLLPILSQDSVIKSSAIWCAPDRGKAWSDWMNNNIMPNNSVTKCDATPALERVATLAEQMGIRGTPYLMFPSGAIREGYVPLAELEKLSGGGI